METLSVVVSEIIVCLVLAWLLGFLASWLILKAAQKNHLIEVEELEDNMAYISACSKNQEREITKQTLKIQEYEKLLKIDSSKKNTNNNANKKNNNKKSSIQDNAILKSIEDNLN